MYGTAGRLLIRGKIHLPKVEQPKFEVHVMPNKYKYNSKWKSFNRTTFY